MIDGLKPYPAYKDSGVPWLGQVPAHWEVRAVRHVTRPVKGRQPKALYSEDEAPAGAQPYLTMEYLRRHKGTAKVYCALSDGLVTAAAGDVLLLWDGANAGEFFIAKDGVVSSTASLLSTDEHDRRYLYFMLKQCEPWLRALSTGMGIPHVDGRILKQMQICLPPHAEQAAIVRFLDWADRRIRRFIRAKQKLIKLLEEYRQALIHQAVTGKIDVRTGKPYPAYKDSGVPWLGHVPAHWEVVPLKRLAWFKSGAGFPVHYQGETSEEIPFFKVSDMNIRGNEKYLHVCANTVSMAVAQELGATVLPAGTIVFPKVGGALLTNKRRIAANQCCIDNNMMGCVVQNGNRDFLFLIMSYIDLGQIAKPGPVPAISEGEVREIRVALPSAPEQTAIAEYLDAQTAKLDAAVAAARLEIELLREFRERLIADVVTGKVDVREVAAQLPDEPPEEEAELMDTDEIAESEGTDDDAAAEALPEEGVGA
jgi:type I restriction enzyme S subunit